ncbi:MAG: hypothetical protein CSA74_08580 [Rhodobacterales bacterium]|nr:MAG: hypothetical protein CSA74_08580 [Rhodobacterales bacterium]
MKRTGHCACGAVRFETTAEPMAVGACHCTDCQKASGGGPNYVALIPRDAFRVTRGAAKAYVAKGGSGKDVRRWFCPDCGTPLWSEPADQPFYTVKLGAFDGQDLVPAMHVFTASAPEWHPIDRSKPCFERGPDAM